MIKAVVIAKNEKQYKTFASCKEYQVFMEHELTHCSDFDGHLKTTYLNYKDQFKSDVIVLLKGENEISLVDKHRYKNIKKEVEDTIDSIYERGNKYCFSDDVVCRVVKNNVSTYGYFYHDFAWGFYLA